MPVVGFDVFPVNVEDSVSVGPVLLVIHAEAVHQFVDNHSLRLNLMGKRGEKLQLWF